MKGLYRFADLEVSIDSVYDEVHLMSQEYAVDSPKSSETSNPIQIRTSETDIAAESRFSDEERAFEGLPPCTFPSPYLETLAVYRKMATVMPSYGVMLLHGSVIAVDGEAYMFTAASGTGKSTHVRLWREMFGDRSIMVNDDKPLIQVRNEERAIVYGTPWDGKHHLSTNIGVPLKAICILERGEKNEIRQISTEEAYTTLLQQSFRPSEPLALVNVMQLLNELTSKVRLYRLRCNMNTEAAVVAYEGMNKDK